MALIQSTAIPSGATDYELEQSLRFNNDDSAYLSKTFASAGNRRTWTWSAWIKRSNSSATHMLFFTAVAGDLTEDDHFGIRLDSGASSNIVLTWGDGNTAVTNAIFRDPSAWMHIVVAIDTTQGTDTNRVKVYVNGTQQTFSSTDLPSQNFEYGINKAQEHNIASRVIYGASGNYYDGYLAEVNFIDGQALTPADFGETGDYGEWKPKEYSGTYGTNGFYLPFKQDYTVEGFSTVTYKGNGGTQYIGGTGFQPDLVWIKQRSNADSNVVFDAVRGVHKRLVTDSTASEADWTSVDKGLDVFSSDGFIVKDDSVGNYSVNRNGGTFVAWNWDMGGSNATNTDGSITSTVRANPTYGQSIVSYTGIGDADQAYTIGHGLSSAPEMIIVKARTESGKSWQVYHEGVDASSPQNYRLKLNETAARETQSTGNSWQNTAPTNSVFTVGNGSWVNENTKAFIAYCFHSVTGYSAFGSFSGTGNLAGPSVTLGFKPAFVLIRKTNGGADWLIFDSTRNPTNEVRSFLEPNTTDAETIEQTTNYELGIDFDSNGFQIKARGGGMNGNGDNYIYMAFADKREYAYWLDQSGNNNDWTSNNLTESDISVDSPTNNFATMNPNNPIFTGKTLSEGNLKVSGSTVNQVGANGTIYINSSGKWYAEVVMTENAGGQPMIGLNDGTNTLGNRGLIFYNDGRKGQNGGYVTYGSNTSWTTGDIMGIAYNGDDNGGECTFYKNGVSLGVAYTNLNTALGDTFTFTCQNNASGTTTFIWNFGQDSSFAGNKTAQGNQDGNSIGDFYYTPPTGFLALCTKNLPDVDVVPSEHFNVKLYNGNGSNKNVSGIGFQPDFTWIKMRSASMDHMLMDAVRGATKNLYSNGTDAEGSIGLTSFNSDGFTTQSNVKVSTSGGNYVAWNWKANGSGSSNTNGSITSTVSANVDAGFSIVSYSGATNATVDSSNNSGNYWTIGHGLSEAPELIIAKNRGSGGWYVGSDFLGSTPWTSGSHLVLNSTAATANNANMLWGNAAPNSSTFKVGGWDVINRNGNTYIAYCFHSVDGYSKVGKLHGNSADDGTFVYTGFKPKMVMWKNTEASANWFIMDSERNEGGNAGNPIRSYLHPNSSAAENWVGTSGILDFTSNGFKYRASNNSSYNFDYDYIFIAFAETPFKYSNAR